MDDRGDAASAQPSAAGNTPTGAAAGAPPDLPVSASPSASPGATPPTASGRRWRTWQLAVASVLALIVGFGIGVAAGSGDDEPNDRAATSRTEDPQRDRPDEAPDPTPTTTAEETTTTTDTTTDEGTRDNPFPLGSPLSTGEGWGLTVNSVNFDAAAEIAAANQFNEPAPPGFRYVLVNATYTNGSAEAGSPGFTVSIEMIGSQNRLWDATNSSCFVVIPEPVFQAGELFPGGTFTGNTCLQVPEAEVADGSLLVAVSTLFGDPVFVRSG